MTQHLAVAVIDRQVAILEDLCHELPVTGRWLFVTAHSNNEGVHLLTCKSTCKSLDVVPRIIQTGGVAGDIAAAHNGR